MASRKSTRVEWRDLFEEPQEWRELQERARSERNPEKLRKIIDEMNQLLSEYEKKAGTRPQRKSKPPGDVS